MIIALLTASLVRPVALSGIAWVLVCVFRVRHPASQHSVWTAVLLAVIALPFLSVAAPQWKLPILPGKQEIVARPPVHSLAIPASSDASEIVASGPSSNPAPQAPHSLILTFYVVGLAAMFCYRLLGWLLLRRLLSRSARVRAHLRESAELTTPVTIGVLRPTAILPANWREWDSNTRRAVLSHEFAHIRRRDAAIASVSRFAKTVLWFHPLVWWLSRQLSDLAELSCDAAVIEKNHDPAAYSRVLLGFAATVRRKGHRAALPGLAMAARADIRHRIDAIFELSRGSKRKLPRPAILLTLIGVPVACFAAVVGVKAPTVLAQVSVPAQSKAAPQPAAQPAHARRFEAASIRLCRNSESAGVARSGKANAPSARLSVHCMDTKALISFAYDIYASGSRLNPARDPEHLFSPIEGGPSWINTDRYEIEAKPETAASLDVMRGPMLQTLLEDRFKLRIHRESRQVPGYVLTTATGGPKLKPFRDGECFIPPTPPDGKPLCGHPRPHALSDTRTVWDIPGLNAASLTNNLQRLLNRPIVDKTGITGNFDVHLEFALDSSITRFITRACDPNCPPLPEVADPSGAPSIFTALQTQLGLKLEPVQASRETLVIDHIERPSNN